MAIVLATPACGPDTGGRITEEQAQAIISQYREARNTANLDLLDDIFAQDVVVHDASVPGDTEIHGLDALKSFYEGSHEGFPDFRIRFDDVLVAEDNIISRWTIEATHTATLRGIPATGREVRFSGVAIDRIEDGRIVEEWVYFSLLDLLQQLGIAPPLAEMSGSGA